MKNCYNCGKATNNTLFGIAVCLECGSKLKLMTEETVKKHCEDNSSFEKEALTKLAYLEKDYSRKKIELLHILEHIKKLH